MSSFFGVIVLAVIGAASIALFGVWGFPFTFILAAFFVAYLLSARKGDTSAARVETGGTQEPTGMPRKASGGAQTANERVGQV
jgi:hypothetical protein